MASSGSNSGAGRRRPWYAEGLNFQCQPDCGECCTSHGAYSYVYLDGDDLPRMADSLGLTPEVFTERYTTLDEEWVVLRMDEPDCPFLDGKRCTVYEARPTQCRTFPFWREHLRSRASWDKVGEFCPGINRGERHPLHMVRARLEEREG